MTPTSIASTFATIQDVDGDGDPDVAGIGYNQPLLNWDGTVAQLAGLQNGVTNVAIVRGGYSINSFGMHTLTFANISGRAFVDSATPDNVLAIEPFANIENATAKFLVALDSFPDVPEPVAINLLGLGPLYLLRRSRHVG